MAYLRVTTVPFLLDELGNVAGVKDANDGEERLFLFQGEAGDIVLGQTSTNHTNGDMTKGQAVYIAGAQGQRVSIELAQANGEVSSSRTFGILAEDVAKNQEGVVVTQGLVSGFNTSMLTEGQVVWLSAATAGALTTTRPVAPNHAVFMGVVVRSHQTQGSVFVKVVNGFEIDELHNVKITNPQNNDVLKYSSALGYWINAQP
jgi:hypothetical protein